MDSYHHIDTIKMEKQKAMQRYRTFKKIANFARTLEIVVAITFISCSISFISSYFPAFVEFAVAFLRRISSLFFSPHFVFFIGNVIIITLFAKSSSEKNSSDNSGGEVAKFLADDTEVEFSSEKTSSDNVRDEICDEAAKPTVEIQPMVKVYRRTKSAVEMPVKRKELRRSETEVRRKIESTVKSPTKHRREARKFEEDELSNEEFRRKVEQFIEKQQRSLREESMAVIVSN